jgi:hypothetical protein
MTENEETRTPEPEEVPMPMPPPPPASPPPQLPRARQEQAKNPALAAFLAVFPGMGHLYVESYSRAIMFFVAVIVSFLMIPVFWPFVFIGLFIWFFGMFDAYREAQVCNLGDQYRSQPSSGGAKGSMAFGVFLTVVGGILLVHNLDLFDLDWLIDWWPVMIVAAGLYFILAAVFERVSRRDSGTGFGGSDSEAD